MFVDFHGCFAQQLQKYISNINPSLLLSNLNVFFMGMFKNLRKTVVHGWFELKRVYSLKADKRLLIACILSVNNLDQIYFFGFDYSGGLSTRHAYRATLGRIQCDGFGNLIAESPKVNQFVYYNKGIQRTSIVPLEWSDQLEYRFDILVIPDDLLHPILSDRKAEVGINDNFMNSVIRLYVPEQNAEHSVDSLTYFILGSLANFNSDCKLEVNVWLK